MDSEKTRQDGGSGGARPEGTEARRNEASAAWQPLARLVADCEHLLAEVVCVKVRNLVVAADAVGSVGNAQRCPQGGQAASLSCSFLCSRRSSMFR